MRSHGLRADRALSYEDVERVAALVRRRLGLSPDERLPGVPLFEGLEDWKITTAKGSTLGVTYRVGENLPYDALTQYDPERNQIVVALNQETYVGLELDVPRDRFSLFHELGHVLFHADQLVRLSVIHHTQAAMMRGATPTHPVYLDTEWQANAFAAAFLMPAPGLQVLEAKSQAPFLLAVTVRNWYGVSADAARYRLETFSRGRAVLLRAAKEGFTDK